MNETPHRIIRNTVTNTLSFGFLFISNLFLLPFIVHALGNEYYGGIWVNLGAITAYMGLIDLGTGTAFVKFISEYYTRGEETSLLEVVNTGMAMYVTIGGVLLIGVWLIGELILRLIGVPQGIMTDAIFVLRMSMLVFVVANVASPVTSVLTGIQRMDISSYVAIGTQVVNIAGTIMVLSAGLGVRGLILNNLVIVILNSACLGWFAFRYVPGLKFSLRHCRTAMARRFLGYGTNLQVSKIAQLILFQTDRILSLRFFGAATAATYDIGARLNSAARSVAALSVSALVPAVAELDALNRQERIVALYERGSKYIAVIATFLFMFIGVFAPDIMRVWMGEQYVTSANVVRILAFGYYFNIITGVASSLAAGLGRTEFDRRFGIFASVFNLVATIGLSILIGPIGIAVGTSLSLVLGAWYYVRLFNPVVQVPSRQSVLLLGRPLLTGIISAGAAVIFATVLPPIEGSRLMGVVCLGAAFVLYAGAFASLLAVLHVFDADDWRMFRSIVGKPA